MDISILLIVLSLCIYLGATIYRVVRVLELRRGVLSGKPAYRAALLLGILYFLGGLACFSSFFIQAWLGSEGILAETAGNLLESLPLLAIMLIVFQFAIPAIGYLTFVWELRYGRKG